MSPFDLNLRHLRALDAIVRHGSMRAASEAVSLSQPALTQGLARLERQLALDLFERRPDGMVPTAAGVTLASRSVRAFEHLARAARGAAAGGTRGFARAERLMTATQLRALLALADCGSFVAAALATGLAEPSLHRAVRDLEQVAGVALAERRGRGVQLTEAGRRLARGARLAAGEIAAGIADISGHAPEGGHAAGRIVIGAMPLARARVLPAAIAAFHREQPGARIEVIEGSWRELVEPLHDGVLDMTIGALRDVPPPGLVQRPLFRDRLVVVGRAGHPLAGKDASVAALSRFGWIVGSPGSPLRAQWEQVFAGRVPPPAPIDCGSVMVMRGILLESDLLTLLSPDQVAVEIAAGLLGIVCEPLAGMVRTIGTTVRAGWRPTRAQARFMALLDATTAA